MELERLTLNRFDKNTQLYMLKRVSRLTYEEALHCSNGWRLEYRIPDSGEIHYLLVRQNEPIAIQYVRAKSWLYEVQNEMAFILTWLGFTAHNTQTLEVGKGQRVPLTFVHNRLPHMCQFEFWHDVTEDEDVENKLSYLETKREECEKQVSEWQERLNEVSGKLLHLRVQHYLENTGLDLQIGDNLLVTDTQGVIMGLEPGKVCQLIDFVFPTPEDRIPAGVVLMNGSPGTQAFHLYYILTMRAAYLARFPRARRPSARPVTNEN